MAAMVRAALDCTAKSVWSSIIQSDYAPQKMVPLARLERALLAELHFECSASTNSTTGALWLRQTTISEIEALLAKRPCAGNGFFT